jgi:transmembrane sensor
MDNYQPYFKIAQLIARYLRNELSADEETELERWIDADPVNLELFNKLINEALDSHLLSFYSAHEKEDAWKNIVEKTSHKDRVIPLFSWHRLYPYAATLLLLFTSGYFITRYLNKKEAPKIAVRVKQDIQPGVNKATLTLANGSKIILSDVKQGGIARQRNVTVKLQNGRLIYSIDGLHADNEQPNFKIPAQINTLTTPRGGQFQADLPDGTKVWLNAASSITYPVVFPGKERVVELTGEAYFEVAKNTSRPFLVKTSTQTVQVLGTHFNVNSYQDEQSVKTTLLEGSIKVTGNGGKNAFQLKPMQQSVNSNEKITVISDADVDEAVAWKNGKFLFRNADLQTVMRQLERWYDVEVEFRGAIAPKHYHGRISRDVPVSQVFEILKTSGVNFIINGRTIIVKT